MSDSIDELNIEVAASANSAIKSLDTLTKKLNTLGAALSGLNTSGISTMSTEITRLTGAVRGMSSVKTSDFTRVAKNITALGKIKSGNMFNVASASKSLSSALTELSNANMSGLQNISGLGEVSVALRKFGYKTSTTAIANIPRLATGLTELGSSLSGMAGIGESGAQLSELSTGIAKLGYKSVEKAITNIPKLTVELSKMITTLAKLPNVSNGTIRLVTAIAKLSSSMGGLNRSSRSAGNGLSIFSRHAKTAKTHTHSLASTIGKLYASYFLVIRGAKALGSAIKSSMDYTEALNYYNVTMNKIGKEYSKNYKKFGYDSAEEYAKSFSSRIDKVNEKLTGYKKNSSGTLESTGLKNLGLDPTEITDYEATVASLTNALGLSGEMSASTSKAFTMLAGDMSSLKNVDLSQVMDNFKSGFVGQTKAVDKYGMSIRMADLQQVAYQQGVHASVQTMTQSAKVQLRMIAMLQQSKVAWGDLANTINSSANQWRMLKTNISNLGRTIGDFFQPIVASILPYLNAFVIVIQRFVTYVANVSGMSKAMNGLNKNAGAVSKSKAFGNFSKDASKAAKNTDKTTKATKKLAKTLDILSFDEINKLSDKDKSTSDGSSANKGANDYDFSKGLNDAMNDYEKVWNKAFASSKNKAIQLANSMVKNLKKGWKNGDFTFLGSALAQKINKGLKNIPWNGIKSNVNKIAKSIATFLNGYIRDTNWVLMGKTLAEGFNTVLGFLYTAIITFDWLTSGQKLGIELTSIVRNVDWKKIGSTFGSLVKGAVEAGFGAVENFDFKTLGTKISDSINSFLDTMSKKSKRTGLTGWQTLGITLSDSITGIADTLITALNKVHWVDVGTAIGQSLSSINWLAILGSLAKVIWKSLEGALKMWVGSFGANPIGTLIATAIGAVILFPKFKKVATALSGIFSGDGFFGIVGKGIKKLAEKIGINIGKKVEAEVASDTVASKIASAAESSVSSASGKASKKGSGLGKASSSLGKAIGVVAVVAFTVYLTKAVFDACTWAISKIDKAIQDHQNQKTKNALKDRKGYDVSGSATKLADRWRQVTGEKGVSTGLKNYLAQYKKYVGNDSSKITGGLIKFTNSDKIKEFSKQTNKATDAQKELAYYINIEYTNALKKSGLPQSEQTKRLKDMVTAANNGKVSIDKVKSAINNLKSKDVKVTATTIGKKEVDTLGSAIKKIPNKTVKVSASKDQKSFEVTSSYVNSMLPGHKTITASIKINKNAIQLSPAQILPSSKQIATYFKNLFNTPAVKTAIQFQPGVKKMIFSGKKVKIPRETFDFWAPMMITQGYKVSAYANGGFPNKGHLFIANEDKPELVGNIGSQTAVVNNNQIVASVSKGVASAVSSVVNSSSSGGSSNVNIVLSADTKAFFRMVQKEAKAYSVNNGKPAF